MHFVLSGHSPIRSLTIAQHTPYSSASKHKLESCVEMKAQNFGIRAGNFRFSCTRFIANAFQFGGDNAEAQCIRRNRSYRCSLAVLRRLASCDMHLNLPGARANELFEERWIETSSMLATGSETIDADVVTHER